MSLTAEQFEARRAYIGGSDAPAIAGVNPPRWSQPIDVYLEKVEEAPPREESGGRGRMMALGSLMEEVVAGLSAEATGLRWRRPRGPYRSRRYPWAGGNVDRLAMYDTPLFERGTILEAKWSQRADGWGEGWSIAEGAFIEQPKLVVPLHYLVQVQHYLAVADRRTAVLAVLLGYADFRWYRIARNDQIVDWLMELEEQFWREHVQAGVPPEPDGSESYGKHLRRLYAESEPIELIASPEQQALTAQLHQALRNEQAAARARAVIEQRLQRSLGTAERLLFPGGSISWRRSRPSLRVEWEDLAIRLLEQAYPDAAPTGIHLPDFWPATKKARAELIREVARALELAHEEPGSRPWKPKFDEDEEESSDASTT